MLDLRGHSDARAVRRVLTGNREAFGPLVTRYHSLVYHVALSHAGNPADAEDLTQEAFLKAFVSLDTLQDANRFSAWLVTITRNLSRDFLRRLRVRADHARTLDEVPSVESGIEEAETRRVLWNHLNQLDESDRELLVLHYFEGKRARELAALYDISTEACAKRIQRARQTLAAEVLNSLGMAADRDKRRDVRKQVMAGIAGLPVAWSPEAVAAAQSAATAAGIAKIAAGVLLAAGATFGAVSYVYNHVPLPPADATIATLVVPGATATATDPAPPSAPAADPAPANAVMEVDPNSGRRSDPNNLGIGEIAGVVRDESGQPVPGAEVIIDGMKDHNWLYPDESEARRTQTADNNGSFHFERLPAPSDNIATTYVVMAFAGDRAAVAETHFTSSGSPQDLTLNLQPARTLSGGVADSTGAPIAGARIYPVRTASEEKDESFRGIALRTLSAEDGRFTLRGLSGEPWELVAMAEGYASRRTPLFAPGVDGLEIILERGEPMRGAVIDRDTRSPAAGVRLLVHDAPEDGSISFSPWNTRLIETGPDGFYTAEHLLPGRYRTGLATLFEDTYVYPPDNVTRVYHDFTAAALEAPPLEVIHGGGVSGRVYDPATGEGLVDVQVTILVTKTVAPAPDWTEIRTDRDGRYRFQGLRDGTHLVFLEQQRNEAREITTGPGEVVENVDFSHNNAAWIAGTVVNKDGNPVPAAVLEIGTNTFVGNMSVRADARGRFEIRGLPPTTDLYLAARIPQYRSAVSGPHTVTREGLDGVTLTLGLPRTASISGIAVNSAGRPLTDARVMADPPEQFLNLGGSGKTGAEGEFEIQRLAAGSYSLQVVPKEQSGWSHGAGNFHLELAEGEVKEGIRLVHEQGDLSISGRVVDSKGQPIARAMLFIAGPEHKSVSTGKDGRFKAKGLTAGDYFMQVSHERYAPSEHAPVQAGAENVEIVLESMARVTGRVVRADTGAPIKDFVLSVAERQFQYLPLEIIRGMGRDGKTFKSGDGAFDIENVKPGPATVIVTAKGFAPGYTTIEDIPAGGARHDVVVRLESGRTVEGRISNEEGAPVPGAAIHAGSVHSRGSVERAQPDAVSAPDGAFTLDSLPDNVRVVTVIHPEYAPGVAAVVWQAGGYLPLDIRLSRGGAVEGTVLVDGSAPASGKASVQIEFPGEIDRVKEGAQVNAGGAYHIEGVRPGLVRVSATYRDAITSRVEFREETEVHVQLGETAQANFSLRSGDGAVEGHVADPNERPLGHTVLVQVDTGDQIFTVDAHLDADRNYRAANLPPGRVTVQYPAAAGRQRFTHNLGAGDVIQQDFDIPAGGSIAYEVQYSVPNLSARVLLLPGSVEVPTINSATLQELSARALDIGPRMEFPWRMSFNGLEPGAYTIVAVAAGAWTNTGLEAAQVATEEVQLNGTEEAFIPFQF